MHPVIVSGAEPWFVMLNVNPVRELTRLELKLKFDEEIKEFWEKITVESNFKEPIDEISYNFESQFTALELEKIDRTIDIDFGIETKNEGESITDAIIEIINNNY